MSEKRLDFISAYERIVYDLRKDKVKERILEQQTTISRLEEENEQLQNDIQKVYKLFENHQKAEKVEEKAKDCLIDSLKEENASLKQRIRDIKYNNGD